MMKNDNKNKIQDKVELYFRRIGDDAIKENSLNALNFVDQEAINIAASLDSELLNQGSRGPLHGKVVVVKDNINVEGQPTSGGNRALQDCIAKSDANIVSKLKAAGAIILGRSNMSELALSEGRLGYSSLGGQTRNPHDRQRDASGSSSGSAVAVAAGFADYGIGTDTAGSIRAPASAVGLIALKPTHNRLSLDGILPLAPSLDVVGPISKSIFELIELMLCIDTSSKKQVYNWSWALQELGNDSRDKKINLAILNPLIIGNHEVKSAFDGLIQKLKNHNINIIEIGEPIYNEPLWKHVNEYILDEFKPNFESFLSQFENGPKSLKKVVSISKKDTNINPMRIESLVHALKRDNFRSVNKESYTKNLKNNINYIFHKYSLDAVIFPTLSCLPSLVKYDETDLNTCTVCDPYESLYLANICGLPEITIQLSKSKSGLPIGVSLLGMFGEDPKLTITSSIIQRINSL